MIKSLSFRSRYPDPLNAIDFTTLHPLLPPAGMIDAAPSTLSALMRKCDTLALPVDVTATDPLVATFMIPPLMPRRTPPTVIPPDGLTFIVFPGVCDVISPLSTSVIVPPNQKVG